MRGLFSKLFKLGLIAGLIAVAARWLQWFQGSPDSVGDEVFTFGEDDEDPYSIDESKLGGEVPQDLLDRLVCPLDKGPLTYVDGKWLVNPRNGYRYPIVDGIPVMLIEVGERYREVTGSA